ncbi:WD40-repeat-containing domain protein [Spinellus fusiger]|nr:WD40-repeat-containing domain protein [Spinellus fusiger]
MEALPTVQKNTSLPATPPSSQEFDLLQSLVSSQLSQLTNSFHTLLNEDFITTLPYELCLKIFSQLDAQSLCNASKVNQAWKRLADSDCLWHSMCTQHIDKKCTKCGWGLPLLRNRLIKRNRDSSREESQAKRMKYKAWKDIYSERMVLECHWRKNKAVHRVIKGHSESIECLQFCDTLNIAMTGSKDKTVAVWDLETGEQLQVMKGHARTVTALQFDTSKLVTGSLDHTLRVWNYRTGECLCVLEGHSKGVAHLNFNARVLASGSEDTTIKIWNIDTNECYTLAGHCKKVNHLQLYNNSTSLVSSSEDGTIRLWCLLGRQCLQILQGHSQSVSIAMPSMPNFFHCFSTLHEESTGTRKTALDASSVPVIISGSMDNTLKVWSMETGQCIKTLPGHHQGVVSLDYDKLRLVSGSQDGTVNVWDAGTGLLKYSVHCHQAPVRSVALSDTKVVSASSHGELHIWDYGLGA